MTTFRADLHIHTVLSPCGDLEMSPGNIVDEASAKGLDIIGITDHNTTRHCGLVSQLAEKKGLLVLRGAEVTTKEEVHCLVFFETTEKLDLLQDIIDSALPDIKNNPDLFGFQVQVDENENIVYSEEKMLLNATTISTDDLEKFVHDNGGLFIPAHIDRKKNSIYSQLGFMPCGLNADAIELSVKTDREAFLSKHPEIKKFSVIRNSDSHYLPGIGTTFTLFELETGTFSEIAMALRSENGRRIIQ